MRKLSGLLAAALVFPVVGVASTVRPPTVCHMAKDCTTVAQMDKWYACEGKANLLLRRSPADCKAKLLGLGATPGEAGRACS